MAFSTSVIKAAFIGLLLSAQLAFAQDRTESDSIIRLKPVVVTKHKKTKIETVDIDGHPAFSGLHYIDKLVSLVTNIPEGRLNHVTFHFNTGLVNLFPKMLELNYTDVKLGLLLYKVGPDGKPGDPISENEIQFVVSKDDNGSMKIDLKPLDVFCGGEVFIGFQILSEISQKENNIYVRFNENDVSRTYMTTVKSDINFPKDVWMSYFSGKTHIKMEVGVEVEKPKRS